MQERNEYRRCTTGASLLGDWDRGIRIFKSVRTLDAHRRAHRSAGHYFTHKNQCVQCRLAVLYELTH